MSELRRRHVVKNALLYLATSWLLLQTADILFPFLRVEVWALPLLIGLLTLFFVPAMIFSWVYEMTPEGLKLEKQVEHDSPQMIASGIKIQKVVIVLLVLTIVIVVLDRLVPETSAIDIGSEGGAGKNSDGVASAQSVTEGPPVPADRSIAILSFINVSYEPVNESFGDSISEQVLNLLARTHELQVTSRTSAFTYKDKNLTTRQLGQALNVANLLEGSVHYFDDQVRITTQLINTSSDRILWSETYDKPLLSVLVVQDQIAAEIVAAIKATLLTDGLLHELTCPI